MDKAKVVNAAAIALLAWLIYSYAYPSMRNQTSPWYSPTVTQDEVDAMDWADRYLPRLSSFAADMFACEAITVVGAKVCSIGGAWELADHPNERYQATENIFMTDSSIRAYDLLKKYNVSYVFAAERSSFYAYGWKEPLLDKFNDSKLFQPIFKQAKVTIWAVR